MIKLGHIAIALYVLSSTIYDVWGINRNVHWSVFYFTSMYISMLLFSSKLWLNSLKQDWFYFFVSFIFFANATIEAFRFNLTWEQYEAEISDPTNGIISTIITILILLIHYTHEFRNNRNNYAKRLF